MKVASQTYLGNYKILSRLGAGGMGEVFLAEDTILERKVAIKCLPSEFSQDSDKLNRFVHEAKAASALNHPNIITIHEIGEVDNTHFIATEYIEGKTLGDHIEDDSFSIDDAITISIQIAEALSAAHSAGIVHRDIKPENIMVRNDGYVKVLDFGLAKLIEKKPFEAISLEADTKELFKTNPGVIMGTVSYMSPEQARGKEVDARSDIFSFGIVLFEMLTRRLPFEGETAMDVMTSILHNKPLSLIDIIPDIPKRLLKINQKTLQKEPSGRYQSSEDLLVELKEFRNELKTNLVYEVDTVQMEKKSVEDSEEPIQDIQKDALLLTDFINLTGDDIFDKTLKLALGITLAQSPSIDIFDETRVRNALRLMGHSADDSVNDELGREICLREALKVYITGTIASLGTVYMLTLEAVNAKTGRTIGRQLEQADTKEKVLEALGNAATGIREKLGESLSSIKKFDVPLIKATTPSLDALKVFTIGVQQHISGRALEAVQYFRRAVEIDKEFAYAYGALSVMYQMLHQPKLAAENAAKAYQFRERTSELEKLRIAYFYHSMVTGDVMKALQTLKLQRKTYPRDERPCINLCYLYSMIGEFDKALEAAEESIRINPNHIIGQGNLIDTLIFLNRFDEAEKLYKNIVRQDMVKEAVVRGLLFKISFVKEDEQTMQELIEITGKERDEYMSIDWQTKVFAYRGQIKKSNRFSRRSIVIAKANNAKETAAQYLTEYSLRSAVLNSENMEDKLKSTLKDQMLETLASETNQIILSNTMLAFAFIEEEREFLNLRERIKNEYSKDFVANQIWIPCAEAVRTLRSGNAGKAIYLLENVERFESAAEFMPQYIRGLSYLNLNVNSKAAAEFQKILDHRGEAPLSLLYPLAQLGKARALGNKIEYEKFFEVWENADINMPILVNAKREYALFS